MREHPTKRVLVLFALFKHLSRGSLCCHENDHWHLYANVFVYDNESNKTGQAGFGELGPFLILTRDGALQSLRAGSKPCFPCYQAEITFTKRSGTP